MRVMEVETTNGIRTREIAVQVRDRKLYTTNRQNDSEGINQLSIAHEQIRNDKTLF